MPCQWSQRHAPISSISWPGLWWRSFTRRGEAMTEVVYSPKIKPEHLARKAIVYLRQSSDKQVRENKESQRLQYDVAERVRGLCCTECSVDAKDQLVVQIIQVIDRLLVCERRSKSACPSSACTVGR